jgi:RNA polymerase sigma factor (sigma-70 family)
VTRGLYERYANQIFRYCLHQLGSREEAEDAVQSTFLNAFRGIKRGVLPEAESAWLFKIAHNVCLSRRRSSWRRRRVEAPADFEIVEEQTPAPAPRADELIGLQDVLEQMPEPQRRAILLREWQGLSYREIARELEVSQAAVETLIFRGRRALATGLEQPPVAKHRAIRALDGGSLIAGAKSLLIGGSAAAKVAATVAAVSTTVVATEPVVTHYRSHHPASRVVALGVLPHAKAPQEKKAAPAKHKARAAIVHKAPVSHAAPAKTVARAKTAAVAPRVKHLVAAVPKRHGTPTHEAPARALLRHDPVHVTVGPEAPAVEAVVEQPEAVPTTGGYDDPRTHDRWRDNGQSHGGDTNLYGSDETSSGDDTARSGDATERRTHHRWWRRYGAPTETDAPASSSTPGGDTQDVQQHSSGTTWRTDGRFGDRHRSWAHAD